MLIRTLERGEVEAVWTIDRRETIDTIYTLQDRELVAQPGYFDVPGWPPEEAAKYTPLLCACFDRGGVFHGAFEEDRLAGVAVIDTVWLGPQRDLLQLEFLHVSRACRGRGLGRQLFALAEATARARGANGLYISATPSRNTLQFYFGRGCVVTATPEPELFAREPDDIHLEYRW